MLKKSLSCGSGSLPQLPSRDEQPCVLIVEDHEDTRLMLKTILEMNRFRVLEAIDGEAAIEVAAQGRPHVILMDLGLPALDGLSAMRRIREDEASSRIPVIFISGWADPATQLSAFAAGCNEFLVKPIDFDRIAAVIDRWLPPRVRREAAHSAGKEV